MKRFVIALLLCVFIAPLAGAQIPNRGVLFKVTGNGHSLMLFGTMHEGVAEYYPLEPTITNAVKSASLLALELDPKDKDGGLTALSTLGSLIRFSSNNLEKSLSPEGARNLTQVLQQQKFPRFMANHIKPVFLAMVLTLKDAESGADSKFGSDDHLASLAAEAKVPVIGLETSKRQRAPFDALPMERQLKMLEEALRDIVSGKNANEGDDVARAWASADQAAFEADAAKLATDSSEMARFFRIQLLDERNPDMSDKIAALLEKQDQVVIGVGAAHLIGKGSIPALLSARGLTVERLY